MCRIRRYRTNSSSIRFKPVYFISDQAFEERGISFFEKRQLRTRNFKARCTQVHIIFADASPKNKGKICMKNHDFTRARAKEEDMDLTYTITISTSVPFQHLGVQSS